MMGKYFMLLKIVGNLKNVEVKLLSILQNWWGPIYFLMVKSEFGNLL